MSVGFSCVRRHVFPQMLLLIITVLKKLSFHQHKKDSEMTRLKLRVVDTKTIFAYKVLVLYSGMYLMSDQLLKIRVLGKVLFMCLFVSLFKL